MIREYNPEIAVSYNNIEKIYQNLGDFYKALKYRKKTLKIRI